MGRIAGVLIKTVIGLVLILFVGVAGLAIRLAAGPMEVNFLKGSIESGLSPSDGSFTVKSSAVQIEWRGWDGGLQLTLREVRLLKADKTAFAALPEVSVKLSAVALVSGDIAPTEIIVRRPSILLRRAANGIISLGLTPPAPSKKDTSRPREKGGLMAVLIGALRGTSARSSPLSRLDRIQVQQADVVVEDAYLNRVWRTRRFNARIARENGRVAARMGFDLLLGEKPVSFRARAYESESGTFEIRFEFDRLDPALFRSARGPMAALNWLKLPIRGRFDVSLHPTLSIREARFSLSGAKGRLTVPRFYGEGLPIRKFQLNGSVTGDGTTMSVSRLIIDLGGPVLKANGKAVRVGDKVDLKGTVTLTGFDVAELAKYWPESASSNARTWVVTNIRKGVVTRIDLLLAMGMTLGKQPSFRIETLRGQFGYRDLSIRFFKPMPEITGATGLATFDTKSMKFTIDRAKLVDLTLISAAVDITGFDRSVRSLHVRARTQGPLKTVLQIIDRDPLGYAGKLGISPLALGGTTVFDIDVWVNLLSPVNFNDVGIKVVADLKDVLWRKGVFGLTLSKGTMKLTVTKRELTATGKGLLEGRPATFQWFESLAIAPVRRRLQLNGTMDAKLLKSFGFDAEEYLQGQFAAKINMVSEYHGRTAMDGRFDVAPARIALPYVGLQKPAGRPGTIVARFAFQNDRLLGIPLLHLKTGNQELLGSIDFYPNRRLRRIAIRRLVTPTTNAALTYTIPARGPRQLRIQGKRLDVTRVFDMRGRSSNAPLPPMVIRGTVERVYFRDGYPFLNLKGAAVFDGADWRSIDIAATIGSGPVRVQLSDVSTRRRLLFTAADAGATLAALNVADEVRGGRIRIAATVDDDKGQERFRGKAVMTNFRILNAPAAMKLFTAASQKGVGKVPPGKGGVVMKEFVAPVSFQRGLIEIRDGRVIGSQLGITINGAINLKTDTLDFRGTIVPAYGINSILGRLTAGAKGDGLIALSYRVTGSLQKPSVSVNPLSVITPPLLRRLFNTYSRPSDDDNTGETRSYDKPTNQNSIGR